MSLSMPPDCCCLAADNGPVNIDCADVQERDHLAFICRLRDYMPKQAVVDGIEKALEQAGILTEETTLEEASGVKELEHIRNTQIIEV